jgi:hypothetical protein
MIIICMLVIVGITTRVIAARIAAGVFVVRRRFVITAGVFGRVIRGFSSAGWGRGGIPSRHCRRLGAGGLAEAGGREIIVCVLLNLHINWALKRFLQEKKYAVPRKEIMQYFHIAKFSN